MTTINFDQTDEALAAPDRLEVVKEVLTTDLSAEPLHDHLAALASHLQVPFAAATVLDKEQQHFLATNIGIPDDLGDATTSHCQYVIGGGRFLCITNAAADPAWKRLARGLIGRDQKQLAAYCGFPLTVHAQIVGAVCVTDDRARDWTSDEQYEVYGAARRIGARLDALVPRPGAR